MYMPYRDCNQVTGRSRSKDETSHINGASPLTQAFVTSYLCADLVNEPEHLGKVGGLSGGMDIILFIRIYV